MASCLYCRTKKIKCSRKSEDESCSRCLLRKQKCINKSTEDLVVVKSDDMKKQMEEIKVLKARIAELEKQKLIKKNKPEGFESLMVHACVNCSTSSFKFCNYLNDCLEGQVKKLRNADLQLDFDGDFVKKEVILPSKYEALRLLNIAYTTVCNDYYLLVLSTTLTFVDEVYNATDLARLLKLELARLFFLFALGEFYTHTFKSQAGNLCGSEYFKTGLSFLRDTYESPSLAQIEVLLLATIYFNSAALVKQAYVYVGICSRLAIILGLNNSNNEDQRSDRGQRIICTIFTLEVALCSLLGYRISFSNTVVNVTNLISDSISNHDLGETYILKKRLALAVVNEQIIDQIYLTGQNDEQLFSSINRILKDLNTFYDELMNEWEEMKASSKRIFKRSRISLKLRFNECMILAIRPILYSVFLSRANLAAQRENQALSHAIKLSERSVSAALSNIHIVSDLFSEEGFSSWGYYDVYFLFSASIVIVLASSMDVFATTVQDTNMTLEQINDKIVGLFQHIADMGYPTARGLKENICQLREKLNGTNQTQLNSSLNSYLLDPSNLEKMLEEIDSYDFDIDFANNAF